MLRILVTGANSFIGKNFRRYSVFKNIEDVSLIHTPLDEINFGKYDVVLHLAAIVHQTKKVPLNEYMTVNRDLCLKVAELAKKAGIKQFIYLSTCKVYGDSNSVSDIKNEDSACHPNDSYSMSKYEAEIGLRKIEDKNFIVSIIRTPLVYGDGVKANMLNIVKLVDTVPVLPFDNVTNKRSFSYTENLIGFIDRIIEKKASGIFIAMDDNALSTTDLVRIISKSLDKKVRLFKLPGFLVKSCKFIMPDVFDRLFSSSEYENSKTKKILDYYPPISTEEGIRRMILSYMEGK